MGELVDRLGKKEPGDLVKSLDWDDLVEAVETNQEGLTTANERLDATIEQLATTTARVDDAHERIDAIVLGTATVHAAPADDLQAKIDALPAEGGELSLAAGTYELATPARISNRSRVLLTGAGAATILRADGHEAALIIENCDQVEVSHLSVQTGAVAEPSLGGALSIAGSADVLVRDCVLVCAPGEAPPRTRATLSVRSAGTVRSGRVRIERTRMEVGAWQVGALLLDITDAVVSGCVVRVRGGDTRLGPLGQGIVVGGASVGSVRIIDNLVDSAIQGIHVGVSRSAADPDARVDSVHISGNVINLLVPNDYKRERHAVFVGNARSVHVLSTTATLTRPRPPRQLRAAALATVSPVEAIRLYGRYGPFLMVRDTSASGFAVGVRVTTLEPVAGALWIVSDTMAEGASFGAVIEGAVESVRNRPERTATPPVGEAATLVLSPFGLSTPAGGEHRVTAVARTVRGTPAAGVRVRFAVSGAAAETEVLTDTTGQAVFTFPAGTTAATRVVTAYVDLNANARRDPLEPVATLEARTTTPEPAVLTFAPVPAAQTIGRAVPLVVTVADDAGRVLANVDVALNVVVNGANAFAETRRTDTAGRASFSFTGATAGTATATASTARATGDTRRSTVTLQIVTNTPTRLLLTPASSALAVGQQLTLTASLLDAAGNPCAERRVMFRVSGPNRGGTPVTTGADGRAVFSYTGGAAGSDTLLAWFDADGNGEFTNETVFMNGTATWTAVVGGNVVVPDVVGWTQADAVDELSSRGLAVGRITTAPGIGVGKGIIETFVIDQTPDPGTKVVRGAVVNLTVQRRRTGGFEIELERPTKFPRIED